MIELKNLAKYRRCLIVKPNLLVVRGCIEPVIAGMQDYNERYGITMPQKGLELTVKELLAGAALAAVSLAERESWGWSLTFKGMDAGFFVGVEPEGMICLRVMDADREKASALIQRQKAGLPLTQSFITPRISSPAAAVEQYFSEADQMKTRLAVREDGEGVLVHALPDGDFRSVEGFDTDALIEFVDNSMGEESAREAGEVLLFYECRCSDSMISGMIGKMNEADRLDLFGDLQQLEIACPRCGRKYTVTRTDRTVH